MSHEPRLYFKMCEDNFELPPHGHFYINPASEKALKSISIFSKDFGLWLVERMFKEKKITPAEFIFLNHFLNCSPLSETDSGDELLKEFLESYFERAQDTEISLPMQWVNEACSPVSLN